MSRMAQIAKTRSSATLQRVVVTTADGRVYDLGKPSSKLFGLRLALYKRRRGLR